MHLRRSKCSGARTSPVCLDCLAGSPRIKLDEQGNVRAHQKYHAATFQGLTAEFRGRRDRRGDLSQQLRASGWPNSGSGGDCESIPA